MHIPSRRTICVVYIIVADFPLLPRRFDGQLETMCGQTQLLTDWQFWWMWESHARNLSRRHGMLDHLSLSCHHTIGSYVAEGAIVAQSPLPTRTYSDHGKVHTWMRAFQHESQAAAGIRPTLGECTDTVAVAARSNRIDTEIQMLRIRIVAEKERRRA
jgi:hypothetical protein